MSSQRFRPDLEGLRGIAIALVILFHAGVPAVAGGFVAVDIFFVLSGLFITGLIVRQVDETGTVDVATFLSRRALRLLPLLLVVLLVTLGAVMWLYAPIDRAQVARTARSVALGTANLEYAREAVDYFSTRYNPLLHTWSLAVEQQFYLIWPLLFLVVTSLAADRLRNEDGELRRSRLLIPIAIAGSLSLAASAIVTRNAPSWAFFTLPTRIWEFSLGATLAIALPRESDELKARGTVLQVLGFVAIALAVFSYTSLTPYPGTAAILPTLGAVALVVGGHFAPSSRISIALSAAPLQWLGRMSYGWYLWHWPLVGIGGVLNPFIGVTGKLAWSALALALAWLTYRLVETPAREGKISRLPARDIAVGAFIGTLAVALAAHLAAGTADRQAHSPDQRAYAAAREDRMAHDCWQNTVETLKGPCVFGDQRASTTLVLLGDSHAEHWLGGLDRAGREHGFRIVAMVKGGCPFADVTVIRPRVKQQYRECTRFRAAMLDRIVRMKPDGVILSSWDHYIPFGETALEWHVSPEEWERGLRRTYTRLADARIPTVVIRGTPRTWFDVPTCLSRRAAHLPFARDCTYDRAGAISVEALRAQESAARGLPVQFIDMNDQICRTARCGVVRDGTVMFTDDNHLTATFTTSLAPVLYPRLASALSKAGL